MAFYKKTLERFEKATQSNNRDKINEIFTKFVKNNHETNYNFLLQRALKVFGSQIEEEMIEDQLQDLYLSLLLLPEEQLLQMEEVDLIRLFRSYVNSPSTVGGLYQKIKYRSHEDIDDYDI